MLLTIHTEVRTGQRALSTRLFGLCSDDDIDTVRFGEIWAAWRLEVAEADSWLFWIFRPSTQYIIGIGVADCMYCRSITGCATRPKLTPLFFPCDSSAIDPSNSERHLRQSTRVATGKGRHTKSCRSSSQCSRSLLMSTTLTTRRISTLTSESMPNPTPTPMSSPPISIILPTSRTVGSRRAQRTLDDRCMRSRT